MRGGLDFCVEVFAHSGSVLVVRAGDRRAGRVLTLLISLFMSVAPRRGAVPLLKCLLFPPGSGMFWVLWESAVLLRRSYCVTNIGF